MKISTSIFIATLLFISVESFAKIKYVSGTVSDINNIERTISIISNKSGEKKVYRYSEKARIDYVSAGVLVGSSKDVSSLNKGESVRLKLK